MLFNALVYEELRVQKALLQEWVYARLYPSNAARLRQLPRWVQFYNRRRPHTALLGLAPLSLCQQCWWELHLAGGSF